jgi:hypothetical protein
MRAEELGRRGRAHDWFVLQLHLFKGAKLDLADALPRNSILRPDHLEQLDRCKPRRPYCCAVVRPGDSYGY